MKSRYSIFAITKKNTVALLTSISVGITMGASACLAVALIININPLHSITTEPPKNIITPLENSAFTQPAKQLFANNKLLIKFKANTSAIDRTAVVAKVATKTRTVTVVKATGKVVQDVREIADQETRTLQVTPKIAEQKATFSIVTRPQKAGQAGKISASQPTWVDVTLDTDTNIPALVTDLKSNAKVETAQPNYFYTLYQTNTPGGACDATCDDQNPCDAPNTCISGICRNADCPSLPGCVCVSVLRACNETCDATNHCGDQNSCINGVCRNPDCPSLPGCLCVSHAAICNATCDDQNPCDAPNTCISGICRNADCPSQVNCDCTSTNQNSNANANGNVNSNTNTPPVVTFTSPADNASYTLGTPVPVSARITDDANLTDCMSGTCALSGLTGYNGQWRISIANPRDLTFSTSAPWTPPAVGTYTLTATAIDRGGLTTTVTRNITVFSPPEVTFTSPADNVSYIFGTAVPVRARITDDADLTGCTDQSCTISGLTGYSGEWDTVITNPRDITFSPHSPWTPPATGNYSLTITAKDADGATSTATHTITIFTATTYPNDFYFNSDLQTPPIHSWGQTYPDLWGLKIISAKTAWDKLYNFTRGDANGDGIITQADVTYVNAYIASNGPAPQPFLAGDVTGDMKINIADSVALGNFIQNGTPFPTPQSLPEVPIAVVDTGVDMTHEDIQESLWTNTDEIPGNGVDDDGNGYVDDVHGWSFGKNNPNVGDTVGHGTHVAGTIAGSTNNTSGVAGVCPSCKIMSLEANPLSSDNLAGGLLYAVNNGAKVISNSWGSVINDDMVNDALDIANTAGVTVVFAAGNSSADAMLFYPQKPYLITVAASDAADNPTSFTNTGSRIDVAAPGVDILSLHAIGTDLYGDGAHTVGSKYYRASGTSMAAPHVAGLAGLILTEHPGYTPDMVRNVLRVSAHDIGTTGWDQASGYGRIDASAALDVDLPVSCVASISYPTNWLNPKDLTNKVIDITGTATCAGGAMQKYTVDFRQGETGTWQQLTTKTSAVENGVLFSGWDTSAFPQGKVTLRLSMTDTRGRIFQDMKELKIGPSVKTTMPPNPIDIQNPFMAPTLADISPNTPGQEIQFAEHAFTGTGQRVPGAWPKSPADSYFTGAMSRNGTIVTQRYTNVPAETTIEFLRGNGDSIYSFKKPELSSYNLFRTVTSIDLNPTQKDGDEIVAITDNNLYVLNASGQQISAISLADEHANYGFGNIDGGNDIEIYTYYKNNYWQSRIEVYKYTGQKVTEINPATYQTINPPYMINDSADAYNAADINHDGKDEIIAVIYQSGKFAKVVAYTYTGAILWEKQIVRESTMLNVTPVYQPTIADMNNDGNMEIAIPSNDYLYLFDENGNELWSKHGVGFAYLDNQPLIVNLDADPEMEILFTSSFGFMYALNLDGSIVDGYPVRVPGFLTYATPAVGDVDGDGLNEIVISDSLVSMDLKLTIFDTDAQANNLWPQFQKNSQRTGAQILTNCFDGTPNNQCSASGNAFCSDATLRTNGDVNGSGSVDVSDAVYLINYIFSGGPAPKCPGNISTAKLSPSPKQNYNLPSFQKKYPQITVELNKTTVKN